nr:hypothetical protein GCM10020093_099380 [Planobispora longispora]
MPQAGDGRTTALLTALTSEIPDPYTVRLFHPLPEVPAGAAERGFDVDQTNYSVVIGETLVVKWLTPPVPLPTPPPRCSPT